MIRKVFVDGKPYLLDDDGTILPPIMGGQWGDYRDPYYGAGTAPSAPPPAGGGPQPGDAQWVTNSVGLLEEQVWSGSRWVATGQVRNPVSGGGSRDGGGGGGGYAAPQWRPGEQAMEQQALDLQQQKLVQDRQNLLDQLQIQHDQALQLSNIQHQQALEILNRQLEHASGLQKEMIQANIDLENIRHENDMKELAVRLEAEQKNILYSEYGATKRTLIQEKGAMERELLQMGPDVAAQAAGLHAQVTRGITPQTMAVGQARAAIDRPIPQMTMDMPIPQMQGVLAGMGGTQRPMAAGPGLAAPIGMAKGGVIEMKKGKDGKFEKQTVLVGEGGGVIPGITEIVTGTDFEVIPLTGMAQAGTVGPYESPHPYEIAPPLPGGSSGGQPWGPTIGGTVSPPPGWTPPTLSPGFLSLGVQPWGPTIGGIGPPTPGWTQPAAGSPLGSFPAIGGPLPLTPQEQAELLRQSLLQMAAPLYAGSRFSTVPTAGRGPAGGIALEAGGFAPGEGYSPLQLAGQLGTRPQLIRTAAYGGEPGLDPSAPNQYGHTFYIDEGGQRHIIPGGQDANVLSRMGFDPLQVVLVAPSDVAQFPPAPAGATIPEAGAVTGPAPEFGAGGWPLVEPTSGAILPEVHTIAGRWNQMSLADQINALSLYRAAGRTPEVVQSILTAATPRGAGARRVGGIGMSW